MRRLALVTLAATLALAACTNPDRPTVQADEVPLPTPLRSFDAALERTVSAVEDAVESVGVRLEAPLAPYRPSEPGDLLQVPRAVRRAALADTSDGFVVIYQAPNAGEAMTLAEALADYVGSGFGQTNFPADTQFSVGVLEDTIVFTTWSQRRSDDPERAEAVFDAVAGVGTPVEVNK